MTENQFKDLINRYEKGECSTQEKNLVEYWLLKQSSPNDWQWQSPDEKLAIKDEMKLEIESNLSRQLFNRSLLKLKPFFTAACIIFCIGFGLKFYIITYFSKPTIGTATVYVSSPTAKAGKLTLSNGKEISLEDGTSGVIFQENGIIIKKLDDGQIMYDIDSSHTNSSTQKLINTIHVPRGSKYDLILPDGSKVFLNAESVLTYSVPFSQTSREVVLSGEAYFEVETNKDKPFKVVTDFAEIIVTGTTFNVNAYPEDRNITTTLLEGGVNISNTHNILKLKPGQQAITSKYDNTYQLKKVDPVQYISWIKDDLLFEEQNLESIMKSISRWYDVEIVYEVKLTRQQYSGTFSKSKGLNELLRHLEILSGYQFILKERRVIVKK